MSTATMKENRFYLIVLILSGLGIIFLVIQGLTLALVLSASAMLEEMDATQWLPMSTLAWSSILVGLLLTPTFMISLKHYQRKPLPTWLNLERSTLRKWVVGLVLVWPLLVWLGYWLVGKPTLAAFSLGILNFLVVGIPILLILTVARSKLDGGSKFRQWGLFGFSLTVMPAIIMLAEIAAILILVLFGGVWLAYRISIDPTIERELGYLMDQVMIGGQDPEALLQLLKPYILQPSVIVLASVIFGGLIPMIEELLKPIGLWFVAGKKLSPQEGFVGGLLCGAGFAFLENLLYFSMAFTPEDWLFMAIGRAGTGVLHMLGSGLIGWGLAKAWRDGKGLALGITLISAFIFHGLWNVLALIVGVAPLVVEGLDTTLWKTLTLNLPVIFMLILSVAVLLGLRRRVKRESVQSMGGDDVLLLGEEGRPAS